MKRFGLAIGFAILASLGIWVVPAPAQTLTKSFSHDFTFGPSYSTQYTTGPTACSPILTWDGVTDAYPSAMGEVCYGSDYFGANIDAPFQLGFLNNGYLNPCNQMHFTAPLFLSGNATTGGSIYVVTGSTTCPYFTGEWGTFDNSNNRLDGFSVMITYKVNAFHSCYRGRCTTYYTNISQGGSGTVTDYIISQ